MTPSAGECRIALRFLVHLSITLMAVGSNRDAGGGGCPVTASGKSGTADDPSASAIVYAVGDLHGDAACARQWIIQTGLINGLGRGDDGSDWEWNENAAGANSSLVFVGDYVDKGPTSFQTVRFVKALTDRFPDRVVALMGNHELELLRDRDEDEAGERWRPPNSGGGFHRLAYATVHPGEYLNYVDVNPDGTDELVVEALYNASAEVYGLGHQKYARMAPPPSFPIESSGALPGEMMKYYYDNYGYVPITEYVARADLRPLVSERLALYQTAYIAAYRSGTGFGDWLRRRPAAHLSDDGTLFVHGGMNGEILDQILRLSSSEEGEEEGEGVVPKESSVRHGVDELNRLLLTNSLEADLGSFLDFTPEGRAIDEIVTYRKNHPDPHFGGDRACDRLQSLLDRTGGAIRRLAVGHTPGGSVRVHCNGILLAIDSTLGRWIRASGNDYCPRISLAVSTEGLPSQRRRHGPRSSNGQYQCPEVGEICEGQIVRLGHNGDVEIIRGA